MQSDILTLKDEMKSMAKSLDRQHQYSRRNCILLHGVQEPPNEDTDDSAIDICETELGVKIEKNSLDRSHRIGKPKEGNEKPRAIIVKFTRYHDRNRVFSEKKKLKGKKIAITESLTRERMDKLKEVKER